MAALKNVLIKRFFFLIVALSSCWLHPLYAADSGTAIFGQPPTDNQTKYRGEAGSDSCRDMNSCLYAIMKNTYGTLKAVNNIPNFLYEITELAMSWLADDKSDSTKKMQFQFATLGKIILSNNDLQNKIQTNLLATQLGVNESEFSQEADAPILKQLPFVNDLSYASLLSKPPVPKAPNVNLASINYIKNASGSNISHVTPNLTWHGGLNLFKYLSYYNTVISVESFNGYVLSNLYADYQNHNGFTNTQQQLIREASNSDWIAEIATEKLGVIFRKLLIFNSQTYVLMTQLLETQKQLLTAQVMTNALLISNNIMIEPLLVSKAQGIAPTE